MCVIEFDRQSDENPEIGVSTLTYVKNNSNPKRNGCWLNRLNMLSMSKSSLRFMDMYLSNP